jgi:hypothetical protein
MTEELIRLWHLERELAEQEMILSLVPAAEFSQAKEKLDSITDAIEALRASGLGGPLTVFGDPVN